MKRIWNLALGTAVLCTALLCGCALSGPTAPDSAAPTDPLTGQELQYPGERTAAVVIDNAASSTTQWGIGSASVVLEALTKVGTSTELCLVYPALAATPKVGPVAAGQDAGTWKALCGGRVAAQGRLCAGESAVYQKKSAAPQQQSWWKRMLQKIKKEKNRKWKKFEFKSCWQMPAIVPGCRQNS